MLQFERRASVLCVSLEAWREKTVHVRLEAEMWAILGMLAVDIKPGTVNDVSSFILRMDKQGAVEELTNAVANNNVCCELHLSWHFAVLHVSYD